MDPIKLVKQIAFAGVVTLIVLGAAGFYIGYSAGRGDLSEVRQYLATINIQAPADGASRPQVTAALDMSGAADFTPVLNEIRTVGAQLKKLEKWTETNTEFPDVSPLVGEMKSISAQLKKLEASADVKAAAPDLSPVLAEIRAATAQVKKLETSAEAKPAVPDLTPMLAEIRAVSAQMKKLEQPTAPPRQDNSVSAPILAEIKGFGDQLRKLERLSQQAAEAPRDDPKLREEVGRLRQLAVSAGEQLNACQVKLASIDTRPIQTSVAPRSQPATEDTQVAARPQPAAATTGTVVLYDSFYLKKDQNKSFADLDLKVALQGVASRSARVDVNNQTVSIAFGERKEIVYNNMTCELNLTETDLNASQARFNIACKK